MFGSRTIIADDARLDNVRPGDLLREDFGIGDTVAFDEVAAGTGVARSKLADIVAGRHPIDASVDARLTRYFGMSDGYFLRLQVSYDMEEVVRSEADALSRIVRRAA